MMCNFNFTVLSIYPYIAIPSPPVRVSSAHPVFSYIHIRLSSLYAVYFIVSNSTSSSYTSITNFRYCLTHKCTHYTICYPQYTEYSRLGIHPIVSNRQLNDYYNSQSLFPHPWHGFSFHTPAAFHSAANEPFKRV